MFEAETGPGSSSAKKTDGPIGAATRPSPKPLESVNLPSEPTLFTSPIDQGHHADPTILKDEAKDEAEDEEYDDFGSDIVIDEALEEVLDRVGRGYRAQSLVAPQQAKEIEWGGGKKLAGDMEDLFPPSGGAVSTSTLARGGIFSTPGQVDGRGSSVSHPVEVEVADQTQGAEDGEGEEQEQQQQQQLAPFFQFRRKGYLSVSDLVGPLWCETQYDYRLRTLPYLPVAQRPSTITSTSGKLITVDTVRTEGKERVMKRGGEIHKRLEREIHPEEVVVGTVSREDVWGLRFLNMFSAVEALLTIGKCREFPVVGFVNGVMVLGIIDEIIRRPLKPTKGKAPSKPPSPNRQTSLSSFFSPTKPRPAPSSSPTDGLKARTHKLFISDSKTRTSGFLPREDDSQAGRLQVMMYKEMLDAILLAPFRQNTSEIDGTVDGDEGQGPKPLDVLPTQIHPSKAFSYPLLFAHLDLSPTALFSDHFMQDSRAVIAGNNLRFGVKKGGCLEDYLAVWEKYVVELGLGCPAPPRSPTSSATPSSTPTKPQAKDKPAGDEWRNLGRTDDRLELVYRRAGGKKKGKGKGRERKRRKGGLTGGSGSRREEREGKMREAEEERLVRLAIAESLKLSGESTSELDASVPAESSPDQGENPLLDPFENTTLSPNQPLPPASFTLGAAASKKHPIDDEEMSSKSEYFTADEDERFVDSIEVGIGGEEDGDVSVASPRARVTSFPNSQSLASSLPPSIPAPNQAPAPDSDDVEDANPSSGSIIGKHTFTHSPEGLASHLESVLQFWMGEREPKGVEITEARRCGWCEFEEGCEWRLKKIEELKSKKHHS
ncbi:hypothetical protein L202_05096 [Cryptococcus amylolentus CBS 6039]|uniref:Exonuclease V, mitochondrial n=1 Tax=Cryptococcus amylolentus CBS 6039 TaxID=1295533 RepID=A0A1E3HNT8_9TREE|nr:hypothetical protein L202_05096 [Cryptococcus amylolentus CBS 6039]ODN78010.1 hypothetical protein L202_05096 [Cryptococcus amylolentus CBS 6039]